MRSVMNWPSSPEPVSTSALHLFMSNFNCKKLLLKYYEVVTEDNL